MPKITVQATRMTGANVEYISLVERGANRIPFRIAKQEKPMAGKSGMLGLDLGAIFRANKAEKPVPAVVAVVTMKGENLEAVTQAVADAGFSVDAVAEQDDGSVVFKQEGYAEGDEVSVIRLSEELAIVTKGFSPYNMDTTDGSSTFAERCAAQQFYPGVRTVMEVLSDSIFSLAYSTSSPKDAAAAIGKLMDEAKAYTLSFIGALPTKAFKLEGEATKAEKTKAKAKAKPVAADAETSVDDKSKPDGDADAKCDPTTMDGKDKPDDKAKKEDSEQSPTLVADEPETGKKSESEGGIGLTAESLAAIVSQQISTALKAATGEITDAVVAKTEQSTSVLAESLQTLKQELAGMADRVNKAEDTAVKAQEALSGVVVGATEHDDAVTVVAKSERSTLGEFDTAFSNVRKKDRSRG